MSEARTITLAFHINDMEAFERDHPNIKALALANVDLTAPYTVVGMSTGNEIQRAHLIEEALETLDFYDREEELREIVGLYSPEEFAAFNKRKAAQSEGAG